MVQQSRLMMQARCLMLQGLMRMPSRSAPRAAIR
jgi:hypothetical protein